MAGSTRSSTRHYKKSMEMKKESKLDNTDSNSSQDVSDEDYFPKKKPTSSSSKGNAEIKKEPIPETDDNSSTNGPIDDDEDSADFVHEIQCVPNGPKEMECYICNTKFDKIILLKKHIEDHKFNDSYDSFDIQNSKIMQILNPHKRKIDSSIIKKFVIEEICESRHSQFYSIVNEFEKELHISDSETELDEEESVSRNLYKCEICKTTFDRRYKIYFHQKVSHTYDELFINCDYCSKKFVAMNLLIHHLKTQCENDEKPTPCVERFKKFLLQANLDHYANARKLREERRLKKQTDPPRKYLCNICNKFFSRQEHLNRHQAVHLPEEMKFQCPICSRKFNRRDNLRSHMKIHLDIEKPDPDSKTILCSYCGKSFGSKSNYVVHMRRHTGEKPYKCEFCDKAFPKSTDLISHRVTHTKEKNYVCKICNKAYARSAVLSKHMRIHNSPFNCVFCKKSFGMANSLKVHLRKHTDSKAYLCTICGRCFDQEDKLQEHRTIAGHTDIRLLHAAELAVEILSYPPRNAHEQLTNSEDIRETDCTIEEVKSDPLQIEGNEIIAKRTVWGQGPPQEIISTNGSSVLLLPGGLQLDKSPSENMNSSAFMNSEDYH